MTVLPRMPTVAVQLDSATRARVAVDLGRCLDQDVEAILARHGLGPPDRDPTTALLLGDPRFQQQVEEAQRDFLRRKVRIEATKAVLDSVPTVARIVQDKEAPPRARVSGAEALARIAGLTHDEVQTTPPYAVTINLPGGQALAVTTSASPADMRGGGSEG